MLTDRIHVFGFVADARRRVRPRACGFFRSHDPFKSNSKLSLWNAQCSSIFVAPVCVGVFIFFILRSLVGVVLRFRGPAPIPWAILKGDQETGVSIIDLHPTSIDAGKIYLQRQLVQSVFALT